MAYRDLIKHAEKLLAEKLTSNSSLCISTFNEIEKVFDKLQTFNRDTGLSGEIDINLNQLVPYANRDFAPWLLFALGPIYFPIHMPADALKRCITFASKQDNPEIRKVVSNLCKHEMDLCFRITLHWNMKKRCSPKVTCGNVSLQLPQSQYLSLSDAIEFYNNTIQKSILETKRIEIPLTEISERIKSRRVIASNSLATGFGHITKISIKSVSITYRCIQYDDSAQCLLISNGKVFKNSKIIDYGAAPNVILQGHATVNLDKVITGNSTGNKMYPGFALVHNPKDPVADRRLYAILTDYVKGDNEHTWITTKEVSNSIEIGKSRFLPPSDD